jgi:hypothetical protein
MNLSQYVATMFFMLALTAFFVGFHDVDNAYNMVSLEHKLNVTMTDSAFLFQVNSTQAYMLGVACMFAALLFFMLAFFVLLRMGAPKKRKKKLGFG